MNKKLIFTLLLLGITWIGFSQQVSQKIGTNPTVIVPSAIVEIESTTKGFLPPRMTFVQRNDINAPATGLIVYCTDCGVNGELQVFNGTTWTNFSGSSAASSITTVSVPTSSGGTLVFMAHNLGADTSANPLVPSWRLNGAYFQWGKKPVDTNGDNYRTKPNNGPEGFAAAPTGPGAGEANDAAVANWSTSAAADGAWVTEGSPLKTANDPCPNGYRVPTRNEWVSIYSITPINTLTNWSNVGMNNNSATNYTVGKIVNNSLFLPFSGYRQRSNGALINRGRNGYYWSSTENAENASSLTFGSISVHPDLIFNRLDGFSVRCVAE